MNLALPIILSLAMTALSAYSCWRDVSRGRCGWGFAMRAAFLCTVLAPQTALYALLPSMDLRAPGLYGFVATALDCDSDAHLRLLFLTLLCWAGLEIGYRCVMHRGAWSLKPADPEDPRAKNAEQSVLLACWVLAIASVAVLAVHTNSTSLGEMAGQVAVGMRMKWNATDREFLPALAFSVLGAMQCQAAFGFFAGPRPRLMRSVVATCIALPALAACGSRRAFIVPIVVTLLTSLSIRSVRAAMFLAVLVAILLAIVIPFGESALRMMADRGAFVRSEIQSDSLVDQCGYVAVELSISQLESLSTMGRYKGPPLLGQDHWTAIARLVVKESLFGIRLPRITRQMTEMHTGDPDMNDVPAGFVGAAWADAGWLGFLLLPVMLGCVAAAFDRWAISRQWTIGGRYCCLAASYLLFFQTMNTGTLDFALGPTSVLVIGLCACAMSRMPPTIRTASAARTTTYAITANITPGDDARNRPKGSA